METFIEKFDFVSATGDLGIINEMFVVEHSQNVGRLLNRGGLYVLLVPDKRYCFDHYNPESTVAEVIDAFANERKTPRLADVIHHTYTRTHNNSIWHWLGDHGKRYGYRETPLEPDANIEIRGETFADDGKGLIFGYIVNLLNALEFIDLRLYRLCHTLWGRLEFIAMLEKI